jgi:hypothetical protein
MVAGEKLKRFRSAGACGERSRTVSLCAIPCDIKTKTAQTALHFDQDKKSVLPKAFRVET